MNIQPLRPDFKMPAYGSTGAAAFDVFMPQAGTVGGHIPKNTIGLGFAAAVPAGHVALILPRSGVGIRNGLELSNTCGVIDEDYRGEWKAVLTTKGDGYLEWEKGERLLQVLIVPVVQVELNQVTELDSTDRGEGGFGSTGQ